LSNIFRKYSNLPLLRYVSAVKDTDPKIVKVFATMVSADEIEQILIDSNNDETWKIFSPSQLLRMLEVIITTTKQAEEACVNVSKGFIAEAKEIKKRKSLNNEKLKNEDKEQLSRWCLLMKRILDLGLSGSKKYALLNLLLDIITVMSEFRQQDDLTHEIMRSMSIDLSTKNVPFSQLCKNWSRCLDKLEWIDDGNNPVKDLMRRFKTHVDGMPPEGCFDAFLSDDGSYFKQISEVLFERSASLFQEKKNAGYWDKIKGLWSGSNKVQVKNLGRLFSRCIENVQLLEENPSAVMKVVTEVPATSSMMKFYPKLLEAKLLEKEHAMRAELILKHIGEFVNDVRSGDLTLDVLFLLKEPPRVDRLMTLVECFEEVFNAGQAFDKNAAKKMIDMRLRELQEYHKAGNDLKKFKSKFDQVRIVLT